MNKLLHQMSIDELQELISKVTPESAAPAAAVLQAKSILFLSNEIAIFKQAICLESQAIQESNNGLMISQNKFQRATFWLTGVIAIAAVAQIFSPQIQALISLFQPKP